MNRIIEVNSKWDEIVHNDLLILSNVLKAFITKDESFYYINDDRFVRISRMVVEINQILTEAANEREIKLKQEQQKVNEWDPNAGSED